MRRRRRSQETEDCGGERQVHAFPADPPGCVCKRRHGGSKGPREHRIRLVNLLQVDQAS